jgi:mono/diheme cytochrome c family protein
MRNSALLSLLLVALVGCDTSNTNPGGHSPEEIAKAKPKAVAPAVDTPASTGAVNTNGAQLYGQYCAVCHNQGRKGPPLEGIMSRREFPSGTPANDARLRDTIKMGRAMMPAFSNTLSDEQVSAIMQYVHTL